MHNVYSLHTCTVIMFIVVPHYWWWMWHWNM